jgi:hypothetical protein
MATTQSAQELPMLHLEETNTQQHHVLEILPLYAGEEFDSSFRARFSNHFNVGHVRDKIQNLTGRNESVRLMAHHTVSANLLMFHWKTN